MRLGEYECNIKRDSLLFEAYDGASTILRDIDTGMRQIQTIEID